MIKTTQKRSIATFSPKEKEELRNKAIETATSSKEEAIKFLQSAGILTKTGKISSHYK